MPYQGPLTALLQNALFKHPKENMPIGGKQLDYFSFLHQQFDEIKTVLYQLAVKCNQSPLCYRLDYLTTEILRLRNYIYQSCDCIESVLHLYLKGDAINAYKLIEKYLVGNPYLKILSSIPQDKGSSLLKSLFKMRKNDEDSHLFTNKEMFHIPLNLRHKVGTYRFSMPGVPCIYLANNLYICSLEVQANPLQNYQASRVELCDTVSVLNLAYCINEVQQWCDLWHANQNNKKIADMIIAWFALYPLMLASAVKTIQSSASQLLCTQGASFVPEYVIPQLLMQYVTGNEDAKLDGIRYLSTKCISDDGWICFYVCWAFPSKTDALQGHASNLKRLFKITDGVQLPVISRSITHSEVFSKTIKNDVLTVPADYQKDSRTKPFAEAEDELWDASKHPVKIV